MYTKTCTSEGQIPSKSEAIDIAATLLNCNCLRETGQRTRYRSIHTHEFAETSPANRSGFALIMANVTKDQNLGEFDRCQKDLYESQPSSAPQIERFSGDRAHVRIVDSGNRISTQHPSLVVCAVTPKQEGRRTSKKCSRGPLVRVRVPNQKKVVQVLQVQWFTAFQDYEERIRTLSELLCTTTSWHSNQIPLMRTSYSWTLPRTKNLDGQLMPEGPERRLTI